MIEDKRQIKQHTSKQLTLPVRQLINNSYDSYYASSNSDAAGILRSTIIDKTDQFVFLLGPEQSGKTHLLEAGLNELEIISDLRSGVFVCLKELAMVHQSESSYIEFFQNLGNYEVVMLDNLNDWVSDCQLTDLAKETILFNFFNIAKDKDIQLVISSSKTVDKLSFKLPDLTSRLKSGLTLRLNSYSEIEKVQILKELAYNKGLSFNDDVASYIIRRSNRGLSSLIDTLTILDKESLASQRKLTIPFIKKTLSW